MRYTNDTERLIKNFCAIKKSVVKTMPELDRKIINDALEAQKASKTEQSTALQSNVWRIIMRNRMTQYAAAAVIILVIIIGFIEPGRPIGASAAFAAAMDNLKQARTFSCTGTFLVTYYYGDKGEKYLMKERLMFKEPDRERREQLTSPPPRPQDLGKVTIWHYGKRQRLQLRPFDKTAEFRDMSSDYVIDAKTGELKLTQLDTRIRDGLLKLTAGAVEDLGSVELDGQSVRLLRSRADKGITNVWVNPKTNYPVQVEQEWTDPNWPPVMWSSVQIDAELNNELFSLEPPEGYTLSVEESNLPDDKAKMMTKIKHLGLCCVYYANDNDGEFPTDLGDLVKPGVIALSRDVLNRVAASTDNPDGPSVFRYRKPKTDAKDRSHEVMLYEIYDQWPDDGIVVCFADGHCEIISDQNRFQALIK
jgi:outer membrane lipoprotein-sorting protein